jgi:hypothetical protein
MGIAVTPIAAQANSHAAMRANPARRAEFVRRQLAP